MKQKTVFTSTFGDTPNIRVLELFLLGKDFDYSITDIAENAGIGRTTLYTILDDFIEQEILIESRTVGRARMLKLNKKNIFVQDLRKTFTSLLKKEVKKVSQIVKN